METPNPSSRGPVSLVDPTEARPHHRPTEVCETRPKYREGRKERAVKVYTVNMESRYLLVLNVPALGVSKELVEQMALYGAIEEYRVLHEYPCEEYTEAYWFKYRDINAARVTKRKMNRKPFFSKLLHVCYGPEFESLQETREKLHQRRQVILKKTKHIYRESVTAETSQRFPPSVDLQNKTSANEIHSMVKAHSTSYLPAIPPPPSHCYKPTYPSMSTEHGEAPGGKFPSYSGSSLVELPSNPMKSNTGAHVSSKVTTLPLSSLQSDSRSSQANSVPRKRPLTKRDSSMTEGNKFFTFYNPEEDEIASATETSSLSQVDASAVIGDQSLKFSVSTIREKLKQASTLHHDQPFVKQNMLPGNRRNNRRRI